MNTGRIQRKYAGVVIEIFKLQLLRNINFVHGLNCRPRKKTINLLNFSSNYNFINVNALYFAVTWYIAFIWYLAVTWYLTVMWYLVVIWYLVRKTCILFNNDSLWDSTKIALTQGIIIQVKLNWEIF